MKIFKKALATSCLLISAQLLTGSQLYAQEELRVLSYNVLKGFQNDSLMKDKYVEWVQDYNPDIVAYQEMNGFSQQELEEFAARYDHPYAVMSKLDGFPVALSSRYPIVNVQKVVDNMWHAYIYANINGMHVFVIHFSPFSYKKRQLEMKEILARAALIPKEEKIIIMGDFNSLSKEDSAYYDEAYLEFWRQREKERSHVRNLVNGQPDYSVMEMIKAAGFKEAVRLSQKGFRRSAPTTVADAARRRRIDYIWVNASLAKDLKDADVIHDEVTDVLSDHYPLRATFRLNAVVDKE